MAQRLQFPASLAGGLELAMTDPILRDATPDDMPAIAALYGREVLEGTATFEETPPTIEVMLGRLQAVRAHGLPWLVAEVDGQVVAWAYASPFRPRAAYRYAVESSIYVADGFQGRGLGSGLMKEVIDRCRVMGLRQMIAAISNDASRASIEMHDRLGFREVGTYRKVGWKFGRWIDVNLMQLAMVDELSPPGGPGLDLA
jgi:L-amino acid N-acyltransferase YncA